MRRIRRRGQDHHIGRDRAGHGRKGREGRGRDDRPGQATGECARPRGAPQRPPARRARATGDGRPEGRRGAVGDDARPQAHVRRADRTRRAVARARRGDQGKPRLQRALHRRLGVPGVHRGREAVRPRPGARVRPARARHTAVAERARLPRRPAAAQLVPRGTGPEGADASDRGRDAGARPRGLAATRRTPPRHRRRPGHRPGDVLRTARGHDRRLHRAGPAGGAPAPGPHDRVPAGLLGRARADRRGDLVPPDARTHGAAVRGRGRQPGPPRPAVEQRVRGRGRRRCDGPPCRPISPPASRRTSTTTTSWPAATTTTSRGSRRRSAASRW